MKNIKRVLAKVKNYNLNVTEVRDSDFKNAFPGIFNFTVGILTDEQGYLKTSDPLESKLVKVHVDMLYFSGGGAMFVAQPGFQIIQ